MLTLLAMQKRPCFDDSLTDKKTKVTGVSLLILRTIGNFTCILHMEKLKLREGK